MKYLLFVFILALGSCNNQKPAKETIVNGDYKIEFLFEHDGCKMYRFYDGTRNVFWANCEGKVNADYETHGGKSSTSYHKEETITTKQK